MLVNFIYLTIFFRHCVPSHAIQLHKWLYILTKQLLIPNSCDLTSRSMKELIYLASKINVNFQKVFEEKDECGNNILMELAKNMKDDALREVLTNSATSNYVSRLHSLIRGVLIQSFPAGAKNFTNYVFCHLQFSGVIQNIVNIVVPF